MGKITVVGLGPGRFSLITQESLLAMEKAENLYFRTAVHPTVEEIKRRGIKFASFDYLYETAENFDELYRIITEKVIETARTGDVVYAVPGSPAVAEKTVLLLRGQAPAAGIELEILPGMSFLEILFCRLGFDPIEGALIIDAAETEKFLTAAKNTPNLILTQVYNKSIASAAKLALMDILPDEQEIIFIHNLALEDEILRHIPLFELDRQKEIDHLTSVFVSVGTR